MKKVSNKVWIKGWGVTENWTSEQKNNNTSCYTVTSSMSVKITINLKLEKNEI